MKKTPTTGIFLLIFVALTILPGCVQQPPPQTPPETLSETTPLDQDVQALDNPTNQEDTSFETLDSDLVQIQDDLNA